MRKKVLICGSKAYIYIKRDVVYIIRQGTDANLLDAVVKTDLITVSHTSNYLPQSHKSVEIPEHYLNKIARSKFNESVYQIKDILPAIDKAVLYHVLIFDYDKISHKPL